MLVKADRDLYRAWRGHARDRIMPRLRNPVAWSWR